MGRDGAAPPATAAVRMMTAGALERVARSILEAAGATAATAATVAASLVESNLVGHGSHGVRRLAPYVDAIDAGAVRPAARPEVLDGTGATGAVNGHRGFGQPAARLATDLASRLAAERGVATVAIRECNHVGRLGEYAGALASQGLIGIVFGNADPCVAPYGGRERRLGTNPFAWAAPRAAGADPIVMDWATAAMAEGKVAVSLAKGETVPDGVIVDRDGRASTDPAAFYAGGALLPFGGHKGYGLSVLIELVGGLLTGTGPSCLPGYDGGYGTVVMAVRVEAFLPLEEFRARSEELCGALRATPPAEGVERVLIPGEIETLTRERRVREGVPVPRAHWDELCALARRVGAPEPVPD